MTRKADQTTNKNTRSAKSSISRRDFLHASAAMGMGALLPGQSLLPGTAHAGEMKVKSCYIPITDATPLIIAHEMGFYKELGIDSERPVLLHGWSAMAESFMSRQFNLTHLLIPTPIYMRYSLGFPVKVVAWDHANGSALTVGKNSGINSYADLGGKQIAVPYWYSIHNIIIQMIARKVGVEPVIQDRNKPLSKNQVNLLVMKPPKMPIAMGKGDIDGYVVAEPFNAAGEVYYMGKIVRFTGDVWKNHPCCVAVMHEQDLANREWSHKVIQALAKAELWTQHNRKEAVHIMSKDGAGYMPLPEFVLERAMMKYDTKTYGVGGTGAIRHPEWDTGRISFQPYQFESTTVRLVEMMKKTKMEGDAEFLQELDPETVHKELMYTDGVKEAVEKLGDSASLPEFKKVTPITET